MNNSSDDLHKQDTITHILDAFRAVDPEHGFFKRWFVDRGTAYYFLFKKNLNVTNIQYAELLSLLVKYRTDARKAQGRLQFLTVREFYQTIDGALSAFLPNTTPSPEEKDRAYQTIAERYWDLLVDIVVIEPLFGSCAVYLPPGVTITLSHVCANSGYIHSCGHNVFFRNMSKATVPELFSALRSFLPDVSADRAPLPVFFVVFAHEDFTKYDRSLAAELRNGLDDVKLYLHKFYLGAISLVQCLEELRREFYGRLSIADPNNYAEPESRERQRRGCDRARTLWFLADRSVGSGSSRAGEERYYVCYEQQFVNESPFHLLDENKPAWIAHTTIPHTLIGAMVNLAWMYMDGNSLQIADPFVGAGTTWLESCKFPNVIVHATDKSAWSNTLTKDNLAFFSSSAGGLQYLLDVFAHVISYLRVVGAHSVPIVIKRWLVPVLAKLESFTRDEWLKPGRDREEAQWVSKLPLEARIVFYTGLKALVRHGVAIRRQQERSVEALLTEFDQLIAEVARLEEVRARQESEETQEMDGVIVYPGHYSLACAISPAKLSDKAAKVCNETDGVVMECNASDSLQENAFDLIVADPPYGFNSQEDTNELARLYREMIPHFLRGLKDGGQLILSLPEVSRTGRPFLFFTQGEMVSHQVLVEARRQNMNVIASGHSASRPEVARPPYYWESEKTLRRLILHFRFRRVDRVTPTPVER